MSEKEQEPIPVDIEIGATVEVITGPLKGDIAKVIAVYTNSVAVELDKTQKDGTAARTVLSHKEYKKL